MSSRLTFFQTCAVVLKLAAATAPARAQFDASVWKFAGNQHAVETFAGRESLALHDALAYMPSAQFRTGTIEFDVNFSDAPAFIGVQFRMQNAGDYEDFYFRPMNSGAPDATQYQPVANGNTGWQIYVGPRYTAPVTFKPNAWMHVRLMVGEDRAAVYIDADSVAQYIPRLLGPKEAGMIALYSNFSTAHFANVRIDRTPVDLPMRSVDESPVPPGAIPSWSVSPTVGDSQFIADRITRQLDGISWKQLAATERGIVNLGVMGPRAPGRSTILARLVIDSDSARVLPFQFGFSDHVRVYLNGLIIYEGDATFRSRDPRFLGTVGLYDALFLPLRRGRNDLVVAVRESFGGGWAITGATPPVKGVVVQPAPTEK